MNQSLKTSDDASISTCFFINFSSLRAVLSSHSTTLLAMLRSKESIALAIMRILVAIFSLVNGVIPQLPAQTVTADGIVFATTPTKAPAASVHAEKKDKFLPSLIPTGGISMVCPHVKRHFTTTLTKQVYRWVSLLRRASNMCLRRYRRR